MLVLPTQLQITFKSMGKLHSWYKQLGEFLGFRETG